MKNEIETIYVQEDEYNSEEFKPPASFFIINAMGEAVYFKTRSRQKAQDAADNLYGPKYKIRVEPKGAIR